MRTGTCMCPAAIERPMSFWELGPSLATRTRAQGASCRLCLARNHRRLSQGRTFSRWRGTGERGFSGGHRRDDDRHGQPCDSLVGWFVMVRDGQGRYGSNEPCGATAGAGRGSTLPTRQRHPFTSLFRAEAWRRRPTTGRTANPVICRRKQPTSFTSMATRR